MLHLRDLTEDERKTIERLVQARSTPVGHLKRAQIIWLARKARACSGDCPTAWGGGRYGAPAAQGLS